MARPDIDRIAHTLQAAQISWADVVTDGAKPRSVIGVSLDDVHTLLDHIGEQETAMRQAWEQLGGADAEDRPVWQARAVLEPFIKNGDNGGAA